MTLAFSWATNTNYSTGPDSGTATKVDPASTANGFIAGTIAAPQHINFLFSGLATELVKAIDGVNGGTYTLGSVLRFEGADIQIAADLEVTTTGNINVNAGAEINVDAGAQIDVAGDLNVLSGGDVEWLSGSDGIFRSGSGLEVASGCVVNWTVLNGDVNFTGSTTFDLSGTAAISMGAGTSLTIEDQNDLVINNNSFTARLGMTPAWIESNAGTLTWDRSPSTPGGDLIQTNVGAARIVTFPVCLPPGDDIIAVFVMISGGLGAGHAGSLPATRPRVSLIKVDIAGVQTTLSAAASPDDGEDHAADATAYDANHLITLLLASPETIDGGSAYSVVVTGETGANSVANTTAIRSVFLTGTARSFRGSSTIMHYP